MVGEKKNKAAATLDWGKKNSVLPKELQNQEKILVAKQKKKPTKKKTKDNFLAPFYTTEK